MVFFLSLHMKQALPHKFLIKLFEAGFMSKKDKLEDYTVIVVNPPTKEQVIKKTKELSKFLSEILSVKVRQ